MSYEKAKLLIHRETKTETVFVMFNPAEYNLTDKAKYINKQVPGLAGPITQFVMGEESTLEISLMFDTYETSPKVASANVAAKMNDKSAPVHPTNVTSLTKKIVGLTQIDGQQHRPPICEFIWGSLKFKGVVTEVKSNYTMFTESGMPVRARLEVTFQSVMDAAESKKKSPFESPDRTKYRTVEQGMQLWHIAYEEYGDPELWRVIAKENNMMNPRDLQPGQMVRLPALI